MRKPRLTPKQKDTLERIARHWGHTFIAYAMNDFDFLSKYGLIRKARPEEIDEHYAGLTKELAETTAKLKAAADCQNWEECKRLAGQGLVTQGEINDREEDAERLVVLNELGRQLAGVAAE